jgi:hypothetical protein
MINPQKCWTPFLAAGVQSGSDDFCDSPLAVNVGAAIAGRNSAHAADSSGVTVTPVPMRPKDGSLADRRIFQFHLSFVESCFRIEVDGTAVDPMNSSELSGAAGNNSRGHSTKLACGALDNQ